jgi:hypothetical protein
MRTPSDTGIASTSEKGGRRIATLAPPERTARLKSPRNAGLAFCSALFLLLLAAGCGAPGEPTPPTPPVPVPITDLAAHQAGDGVQLTFTMPEKTISGDTLAEPPAIEILRGTLASNGLPDAKSFRVATTIPGALAANYRSEDRVQILVPVTAEELRANPGDTFVYRVRTQDASKHTSAPLLFSEPRSRNPPSNSAGKPPREPPQATRFRQFPNIASIAASSIPPPPMPPPGTFCKRNGNPRSPCWRALPRTPTATRFSTLARPIFMSCAP